MGDYWFKNKKTKKFTLKSMTISEMEEYLKKNKHIERAIYKSKFPDSIPMRDTWIKHTDDGWKDKLREIKKKHPLGNIEV